MEAYSSFSRLSCYLIVPGIKNKPDGTGNYPVRYESVFLVGAKPLLGPFSKACCYGAGSMCGRQEHNFIHMLVQHAKLPSITTLLCLYITVHVYCMLFFMLTQCMLPHSDDACCVWLTARPCYVDSILNRSQELSTSCVLKIMKDWGGSKGIRTLIKNVLGESHTSSLASWPLAFCGRDYMYEKCMDWRVIAERAQRRRPPGTWSEYWGRQALGKPHYTFRGVLFSPSLDSWTAKLLVDQ